MVDLHTHSKYSFDADQEPAEIADMAAAAAAAGVDTLAVTDHYDLFRRAAPIRCDLTAIARDIRAARPQFAGQVDLLFGVELGEPHANPAQAEALLAAYPFDVVIGSLHAMPNDLDIYFHDYANLDCDAFLQEYFDQLLEMEAHGGFDVLAHIDYPLRVMKHGDYVPSFDQYMDRVQQVLRACIDHGYALELNAAGLGAWMKKVGPPQDILYEYRRMGGERISIGSDSHKLDNVGRGFDDCVKNARDAGFTSVTMFRNRRPEQVALG